jgi:hypothetical protein
MREKPVRPGELKRLRAFVRRVRTFYFEPVPGTPDGGRHEARHDPHQAWGSGCWFEEESAALVKLSGHEI